VATFACRAALTSASRADATRAAVRSSTSRSPTTTTSTVIAYVSSTSAAACSMAALNRSVGDAVDLYSQFRSVRSWPRASRRICFLSSALRWMSTSVCSTWSWIIAASSARSCSRTRASRSVVSWVNIRHSTGASASPTPPRPTAANSSAPMIVAKPSLASGCAK